MWTFAAVAFPFVPFRFFVRWKVFHKLFVDDFLVLFAYLLLLVFAIMWQIVAHDMYAFVEAAAGLIPIDQSLVGHYNNYLKAEMASMMICALCLWSIKLSFLLFFRRLGYRVPKQRSIWWLVLVVNILALAVWIGIMNWRCMILPWEEASSK